MLNEQYVICLYLSLYQYQVLDHSFEKNNSLKKESRHYRRDTFFTLTYFDAFFVYITKCYAHAPMTSLHAFLVLK